MNLLIEETQDSANLLSPLHLLVLLQVPCAGPPGRVVDGLVPPELCTHDED